MKLYYVEIKFGYYALANSKTEALEYAQIAASDTDLDAMGEVNPVGKKYKIAEGWTTDDLVYHEDEDTDITLGECLEKMS